LPFLDGIRGIAIVAVFLVHSLGNAFGLVQLDWNGLFRNFNADRSFLLLYPLTYGVAGVSVFFAVSGFCIHLSHKQSKEKGWMSFLNRRFFRLYPPYLLAILVFFFLWPVPLSIRSYDGAWQLVTHLFAIHNLFSATTFGLNMSFWSIAVEIQLYAIYPILLLITRKYGWRNGLIFVGCIEMLIRSADSFSTTFLGRSLPSIVTFSPFGYWLSWSVGAYVAQCFLDGRVSGLSRFRFDVVAVIAFTLPLFKPTSNFSFLAFSLATGIAIDRLISKRWELPKNLLFGYVWKHLSFLGLVSYSFYLFHQPIVNQAICPLATHPRLTRMLEDYFSVSTDFHDLHPLVKFFICCAWYPAILALACLIYRVVERPSIELGKALWKKFSVVPQISG